MDDEKRKEELMDAGAEAKADVPAEEKTQAKAKKKKPIMWIACAALAVVLACVIFLPGRGGDKSGFGIDTAMDSYNDLAGSMTMYTAEDGSNAVQGTWDLYSVVIDGEETEVAGTGASGTLEITGNRWSMTLNTDTTSYQGGDFEAVRAAETDSGRVAYLYRFYSDTNTGYVEAILMPDYPMICLSVSDTFDSDNFFAFGR